MATSRQVGNTTINVRHYVDAVGIVHAGITMVCNSEQLDPAVDDICAFYALPVGCSPVDPPAASFIVAPSTAISCFDCIAWEATVR